MGEEPRGAGPGARPPDRMGDVVAAKVKCPSCGAKNPDSNRRCRVCTAIINANLPEPGKADPAAPAGGSGPSPLDDVFDPNAINNQLRPASARFSSSGGGLGARIAAAQGDKAPTIRPAPSSDPGFGPPAGPVPGPGAGPVQGPAFGPAAAPAGPPPPAFGDAAEAIVFEVPPRHADTPPPIEYESEKFDPDALFGDG